MADEVIRGTLVRGPDGGLYCIPDEQLEKLRVPDERLDTIEDAMDAGGTSALTFSEAAIKPVAAVEGEAGNIFGIEWGSFGRQQ